MVINRTNVEIPKLHLMLPKTGRLANCWKFNFFPIYCRYPGKRKRCVVLLGACTRVTRKIPRPSHLRDSRRKPCLAKFHAFIAKYTVNRGSLRYLSTTGNCFVRVEKHPPSRTRTLIELFNPIRLDIDNGNSKKSPVTFGILCKSFLCLHRAPRNKNFHSKVFPGLISRSFHTNEFPAVN